MNSNAHHVVMVDLQIPADEYIKWYRGDAKDVFAVARDGRSVQFPADILQPFVTHEGICGCFEIEFDESGKLVNLSRLSATY